MLEPSISVYVNMIYNRHNVINKYKCIYLYIYIYIHTYAWEISEKINIYSMKTQDKPYSGQTEVSVNSNLFPLLQI